MTTHHEYMHAYFRSTGFNFNADQTHKIIDGWHHDQYYQWKSINQLPDISFHYGTYGNFSRIHSIFGLNHYSHFGFKIINYMP